MKCPICNIDLLMADKQGIEIDYCPKCRGIWLDRGELEKIIERSLGPEQPMNQQAPGFIPPIFGGHDKHHDDHHGDYQGQQPYGYRRKKSFLGEMFDF
jgi:Zn-finger nucleic acid-binding protein